MVCILSPFSVRPSIHPSLRVRLHTQDSYHRDSQLGLFHFSLRPAYPEILRRLRGPFLGNFSWVHHVIHTEKEKSTVASSDQTWLAASWEVCQPLKLEIIEGESSNFSALRRSKDQTTLWIEDKPGLPSQVGATMLYVIYNL